MADYAHRLLWCFIIGDSNPFHIRVSLNATVSELKQLIWNDRKHGILREFDYLDLILSKVSSE